MKDNGGDIDQKYEKKKKKKKKKNQRKIAVERGQESE